MICEIDTSRTSGRGLILFLNGILGFIGHLRYLFLGTSISVWHEAFLGPFTNETDDQTVQLDAETLTPSRSSVTVSAKYLPTYRQ